jgi:hypothetical protein
MNENQKLFLESYFDIAICTIINFYAFWSREDNDGQGILAFMNTSDDIFCTLMTLIHLALLVLFPLLGAVGIYRNFRQLKDDKVSEKYKIFLDGNKTKTKNQALFTIFFIVRRVLSVFALIYFRD